MKREKIIQFIIVLVAMIVTSKVFSMEGKGGVLFPNRIELSLAHEYLSQPHNINKEPIIIYKEKKDGLNIYTFTPEIIADKDLLSSIESRLKVMIEGFVSLSANNKNDVKIVTDSKIISDNDLDRTINIVIKVFEYYSGNYKITER